MTCEEARELLTALVDHELSDLERPLIESHLQACAKCRRIYEHEQAVKGAIHNLGTSMAAPAELKQRIVALPDMFPKKPGPSMGWRDMFSMREFGRSAFAFVLAFVILVPAIYFFTQPNRPVAMQTLQIEAKIARGELLPRIASDQKELRDWQIRAINGRFTPMEYNLSSLHLHPTGGLVRDIDGRRVLVTIYSGAGPSVTCFTFIGTEQDAPQNATVFFDQSRNINFYLFSGNGYNAVLHRQGNVICILVSKLSSQELLDIIKAQSHKT